MIRGSDVVAMLRPNGGWVTRGNEYEDIEFIDCEPITKAQFKAGFDQYDAWKTQQDAAKAQVKAVAQSKLAALGLTMDDLRALGL